MSAVSTFPGELPGVRLLKQGGRRSEGVKGSLLMGVGETSGRVYQGQVAVGLMPGAAGRHVWLSLCRTSSVKFLLCIYFKGSSYMCLQLCQKFFKYKNQISYIYF